MCPERRWRSQKSFITSTFRTTRLSKKRTRNCNLEKEKEELPIPGLEDEILQNWGPKIDLFLNGRDF